MIMTDDSIVLSNRTLQFCLRPFLVILQEKFVAKARMSPQFFMRHCESMLIIADMLEKLPLSLEDRFLFCICPVDTDDHMAMGALLQFATEFSRQEMVTLKKVITPATIRVPRTQTALQQLESLHKVLELYVWLSLRMEDAFVDQEAALSQKELCGM
jgi:ATP-dependent RNA helicase SUPV3L1/SUV3